MANLVQRVQRKSIAWNDFSANVYYFVKFILVWQMMLSCHGKTREGTFSYQGIPIDIDIGTLLDKMSVSLVETDRFGKNIKITTCFI